MNRNRSTSPRGRVTRLAAVVGAVTVLLPIPLAAATDSAQSTSNEPTGDPALVWHWNDVAMGVLTPSGRPLHTQHFVVTAMHVAIYDAVVATTHRGRAYATDITAPAGTSATAAAATAAHRVFSWIPSSERRDLRRRARRDAELGARRTGTR